MLSRLQDVRDEFDEFQEGSRELEHELEAQLEQYEQRVKDLVNTKSSLEEENEMLKVMYFINSFLSCNFECVIKKMVT